MTENTCVDLGTLREGTKISGVARLRELKEAKVTTVHGEVVRPAFGGTYIYIAELDAYYTPERAGFVGSDWTVVENEAAVPEVKREVENKPEAKAPAAKKPTAKKATPKKVEPKGAVGD